MKVIGFVVCFVVSFAAILLLSPLLAFWNAVETVFEKEGLS